MARNWLPRMIRWVSIAAATAGLGVVGCAQEQSPQGDTAPSEATIAELPQVVATTGVLCDLTQQIAQDTVELVCLVEPGQDPHTYQPRPSDRQAIDAADLVLYDGYGAAPGLLNLVEAGSSQALKVAVLEAAVPDPLMGEAAAHDHGHDHGHDHDHADETPEPAQEGLRADPHVWHRAENNGAIAEVIATHLAEVNPDQADLYQQTATELGDQFAELDTWIQAQVDTIPASSRNLVTIHDAFRYYADAYGLEVKGALSGLSTEERPSAETLTSLVDQVKAAQVPAIFAETTSNPDLLETLASNAGVKVAEQPLFVEGPGGPGTAAETTQAMLVANTCTIVNALGGRCSEAAAPL